MINVVSWGMGTNSTAMIIEMIYRGVRIDRILCADTGGERPETYQYIDLFQYWLYEQGIDIEIEIVKDKKRTLEEDCLIRKALPAITYGRKSCSLRYKVAPQRRALKGIAEKDIMHFIGYDAGEPWRARHDIINNRYPLIEWGISREKCKEIISNTEFLTLPGKSSCFFCPNMKPHEILKLPVELQDRAIAIERNAKLTKLVGLGRTWKWEDMIMADRNQMKFNFRQCDVQMPCECYD